MGERGFSVLADLVLTGVKQNEGMDLAGESDSKRDSNLRSASTRGRGRGMSSGSGGGGGARPFSATPKGGHSRGGGASWRPMRPRGSGGRESGWGGHY